MTLTKLWKCVEYLKDTWRLKFRSSSGSFGEEANLLHLPEYKPLTIHTDYTTPASSTSLQLC